MKAVLLHQHGGIDKLKFDDYPTPEPGAGEVLVRILAAALNRVDVFVREGWPGIRLDYPHILGSDGAGEIAALGPGVQGWTPGDRVVINANISDGSCEFCQRGEDNRCVNWHLLGETVRGTNAEFVVVPEGNLYPIPDGFNPHDAAAAALVFQTAWHSLISRGKLRVGESVLIVGASGGVNTASIQVAKLAGATVYVVGSSPEKLALAESLGADHLIDRRTEDNWSKTIYQMTKKRGVDVVVDNVGTTFPLSFRAVRKGGRILTVGNTAGARFEIDNRYLFGKHLSIHGSSMSTRTEFSQVMDLVFAGRLKPVLDQTYPLTEIQTAHRRLELGEQMGKITLAVA